MTITKELFDGYIKTFDFKGLNQIIRPFTAKWHKKKLSGEFSNENECIQFRTELKQLQADLICYSRLLADMAKVEDLTCLLEEDE